MKNNASSVVFVIWTSITHILRSYFLLLGELPIIRIWYPIISTKYAMIYNTITGHDIECSFFSYSVFKYMSSEKESFYMILI